MASAKIYFEMDFRLRPLDLDSLLKQEFGFDGLIAAGHA
jgi:hypothetical protein